MDLSKLLESIDVRAEKGYETDGNIKKLAYHSSRVEPDTLFVCIRGFQIDGHDYAGYAEKHGAAAIVVERFIPDITIPQFLVADSRKALAQLSDSFYEKPSRFMRLFGVTGTNGKTTITYMTDAVFRAYELKTGLIGTIMVKYDDVMMPSVLTTPESLDLQKHLADMRDKNISHVSMEVSSSALELQRVANVAFDVAAFINISRDHIDLHGSYEAYFNAKASFIREASKDSVAVLNIDEPSLQKLTSETKAQVITFGIENTTGHLSVSDIDLSSGTPECTVHLNKPIKTLGGSEVSPTSFRLHLAVLGRFSIYNALTAIAAGLVNAIPVDIIKQALEGFKGVERRFQLIYNDEFMIIDDLMLNENNIDSSMATIEALDYDSVHFVHAVRGNRGASINRENAENMADWFKRLNIKQIILTASRSHVDKLNRVTEEEIKAYSDAMKSRGITVDFYQELPDALSAGLSKIKTGDLLMITGAHGMDYGTKLTLNALLERRADVNRDAIKDVLNRKVIGIKAVDPIIH
ncbi:MAG: UDP-N-acetylmuramyl-tripeptide synthetase [Alkalibacterium sp.]|uniref:Mur ligase family protein n=1 Tax=Alkalibacterium sp. TaxID=1872447 RepID=UPI003970C062